FPYATLTGWGASTTSDRTHSWCSVQEKTLHINELELKAVFYDLKYLTSHLSTSSEILLRIDNTTAVVKYPHLSSLSKEIWQWYEIRNIRLFASYIASAKTSLRMKNFAVRTQIRNKVFQLVDRKFGSSDIDWFASNINAKSDIFVSWFPDPLAMIHVSQISISAEKAFICIPVRLKTSASGRPQPLLRHASTSLAARKGVPVDLIKCAAGWSGEFWYSRIFIIGRL
ncbi:hypothetical protein ALC62_08663, partial [Cyphomyrmex costatus]